MSSVIVIYKVCSSSIPFLSSFCWNIPEEHRERKKKKNVCESKSKKPFFLFFVLGLSCVKSALNRPVTTSLSYSAHLSSRV